MFQGGLEYPRIQHFARWKSDAAHDYLWESHEQQKGLSELMTRDAQCLLAPTGERRPFPPGSAGGAPPRHFC